MTRRPRLRFYFDGVRVGHWRDGVRQVGVWRRTRGGGSRFPVFVDAGPRHDVPVGPGEARACGAALVAAGLRARLRRAA